MKINAYVSIPILPSPQNDSYNPVIIGNDVI